MEYYILNYVYANHTRIIEFHIHSERLQLIDIGFIKWSEQAAPSSKSNLQVINRTFQSFDN